MIRVAHISDSHCDERGRLVDWRAVHAAFFDQVREFNPDLILHTGDLFERRSTPAERNAVADWLLACSDVCPVAIVQGNHDAPGDLDIFRHLGGEYGITVFSRPTLALEDALHIPIGLGRRLTVLALPWFDRANVAALLPATSDQDRLRETTLDAARQLLAILRMVATAARNRGDFPILGAHVMVGGSETSSGQTLIGQSVEFAPAELADIADYVALGHIHKPQQWDRVGYVGSPMAQNFGEDHPHGWNAVSIGESVDVQFRELPGRRIRLFTAEFDATGRLVNDDVDDVRSSDLVRIRYRVPAEALPLVDEARIRALVGGEPAELKLEAVVLAETRARCSEITAVTSMFDKVLAYFDAKSIRLGDDQLDGIRAKLASIEQPTTPAESEAA